MRSATNTRLGVGAALAVSLWLAGAGPAPAHVGHDGGQLVIEGIEPAEKGVLVTAVPGAIGKLRLSTTGATTVEVLGSTGQPMLRVGPGGVDANATSPDWYAVNEPLGIAQVPATAKPTARERWTRVSKRRSWEWFDHRFHPPGKPVYKWTIPIRVDGEPATIRGRIAGLAGTFEPKPDAKGLPPGVTVSGVPGPMPSLGVASSGDARVSVLGPDGEVFARIGAEGAEVNVRSTIWVPTAQAANRDLLESVIDPSAKPQFVTARRSQDMIWPDPRILPRRLATGAAEPGDAAEWTVPLLVGGKRVTVRGTTVVAAPKVEATPAPVPTAQPTEVAAAEAVKSGSTVIILGAIAAAVAVLAAGALVVRRRRRA